MSIKISEDKELVEEIKMRLLENKAKYGKPYCPCVLPSKYSDKNNEEYICMCKEFREQKTGECHCGLYVKIGD